MHTFICQDLNRKQAYKLLTASVVPRPIAWVSTLSEHGVRNLAPFSFFNAVAPSPPTVMFSVTQREGKFAQKDTYANIMATRECVINIVSYDQAEAMNLSAQELPADVDEFVHSGVTPLASQHVKPFRVAEAPVQMECTLQQVVTLSNEQGASQVVFCEVVAMHISDEVYMGDHKIDASKLRAVGRLAGNQYATTDDLFSLMRPPSQLRDDNAV
jgi:flavin reductase (DIM6/NTAB) family NADH-FMN oxidoreductase RutF